MKKQLVKVVCVMGLFSFLFGCAGCKKQPSVLENKVKFSAYTQQERKDYINDYLEKNYSFRGEVSDVKQKQITPFKTEEHYFATVRVPEKDLVSVWVSEKGEITDTVFMQDMQPRLTEYFREILAEMIPEFELLTHTDVLERPSGKLTAQEDIRTYLSREGTSTCLRIFVDDASVANEALLDRLEQKLNFCHASIYLYVCPDLGQLDLTNYDLDAYTHSRIIFKEG